MKMKLLALHDPTIRSIIGIDRYLRTEYLCCPSYHTINGQWIIDAYGFIKSNKIDQLKYHVTREVSLPRTRAYQAAEIYQKLDIFKPYLYLLDVSTIAFLENNWLCSYLSLLPVVEGIFREWGDELQIESLNGEPTASFIGRVLNCTQDKLDTTSYYHRHLNLKIEFLRDVLSNDFFKHGSTVLKSKQDTERVFNRHIPAHMLRVPKSMESGINTANLFLFIDLIAELYLQTNSEKYPQVLGTFMGHVSNKRSLDNYFELFLLCAVRGQESSYINRLHNICYEGKAVA